MALTRKGWPRPAPAKKRPVAANDTPEGRALNRRVELIRFTDSAEAKRLLKAMSDDLAAQTAISFDYNATLEVVTNDDQKLALASSGTIALNRPDKIHATRAGGFVDAETVFDGKTLTLLGKNANKYTQLEAPGTIEHLIDELRDKYYRPLPAADLLMSNSYAELMQDVYNSKDLGSGVINGAECDFLAFRAGRGGFADLDRAGGSALSVQICRDVQAASSMGRSTASSSVTGRPGSDVATDDFTFQNSTNAEKIDLKDLQDKIGEFPSNFAMGDKQ